MADIADSKLREELVAFGEDVGPITNNTRNLWLKKLHKLNAEMRKKRSSAPALCQVAADATNAMGQAFGQALRQQSKNVIYPDFKPKEDFTLWLQGYREKIRNAYNYNPNQDDEVNKEVVRSISGKLKSGTALDTYGRLTATTKADYTLLTEELTQEFLDPQEKCRFIENIKYNKRKKGQALKEFMQEIVKDQNRYSDLTGSSKIKEGVRRFKKGLRNAKGEKDEDLKAHMCFHLHKDTDLSWEKALETAARWEAANEEEDSSSDKNSSSSDEVEAVDERKGARSKVKSRKQKMLSNVEVATLADQVKANTLDIKGVKSEVERNFVKVKEWKTETNDNLKTIMKQMADGFQGQHKPDNVTMTGDQFLELAALAQLDFGNDDFIAAAQGAIGKRSSRSKNEPPKYPK